MSTPERWLQGPVPGIHPLLQPAAHALLQASDDVLPVLQSTSAAQLWSRPGGSASIGYHVVHLAGSLDRLFTYARGESLSEDQMAALRREREVDTARPDAEVLQGVLTAAISAALDQLRDTDADRLVEARHVGRQQLPSTVLGLLFHGAEHSTRHAGQIRTLARVVSAEPG